MEQSEFVKRVNRTMPGLPYLGFAFWFAWNLVAFSGSIWLTPQNSSILINHLFAAHLIASTATLLALSRAMGKRPDIVLSQGFLACGAVVGSVGTLLMIVVGGGYVDSLALFAVGGAMAGAGTSCMLVRSGIALSLVGPSRSFHTVCLCALFAIAAYFVIEGYASVLGAAMFVLLPVLSALSLSVHRQTPAETRIVCTVGKLPRRFCNLLLAIFVYSLSQAITKGYILADLPAAESVLCMSYVMLALIVLMVVFILVNLLMPVDRGFGRIFYPLAIALIVPQMAMPFFDQAPIVAAAGIDFAGYGFDLLVWSMCAYLGYQMRGNCVKAFCWCTASLSMGLAIGNLCAIALQSMQLSTSTFIAVNCVLAAASLVVTVFVFPESRLHDLFLPVDEGPAEDAPLVTSRKARFRRACDAVAEEGGLSNREREVFDLLVRGHTAQQIADELVISVHTARAHIRNIHAKLEVGSRKEIDRLVDEHME